MDEASHYANGSLQGVKELTGSRFLSYLTTEASLNTQTWSWRILHDGQSFLPESHILTNSCNIEQASRHGDHNNIIAFIMNKKGLDLDGALDCQWLAEYHGKDPV
ncbi:hypothetical protein V8E53_009813 [Lactarius tabidus]